MATKISMPQLGESVVEGTVSEWLFQVGDTVNEYDPVVRISTDKVDSEIPAPASGVLLAIQVPEGETVEAGVVLGLIGQPDEAVESGPQNGGAQQEPAPAPEKQPEPARASAPTQASSSNGYSGHITPVVARMAAEHNLDLGQITGTGRGGRITKKDVMAHMEQTEAEEELAPWERPGTGDLFKPTVDYEDETPSEAAGAMAPARPAPKAPEKPAPAAPKAPAPSDLGEIPGELEGLTPMRRMIAEHMVRSKHTAPHATTIFEVDLAAVVAHRNANKESLARQGVKLTFTPYFVAACVVALREVPAVNARWTDEGLYYHHAANIGLAVAIPDGLIVPVVKNAQDYNLTGLARQVNDLAERARSKQLKPDEIRGGTFTITNHGVSGSLFATPIINQPQSAILGVGAIEKRVRVVNDAIAIRPCAYLSLTFDHRVIDGASADAFVAAVKRELENWH